MWDRIDHRIRNNGGSEHCLLKRCYGPDGEVWPRIAISISPTMLAGPVATHTRIDVSISHKDAPGDWWGPHGGLPHDLVPELIDMLREFHENKEKLMAEWCERNPRLADLTQRERAAMKETDAS